MLNMLKTAFWMAVLTVLLVMAGRVLAGITGMLLAFGFALAVNGFAYWFSDRLALAAASAREVSPAESRALHSLADRLAIEYGVPKPRVYLSPDPSPNAFATGRSARRAAICVTAGLTRILDARELHGVLAHEFGHIRNRDVLISSVVAVMAGAISVLANLAQWSLWLGGGRRDRAMGAASPVVVVLMILLAPLAAMLIRLAISRGREYQADRSGALVSGDPLALASALRKLEEAKLPPREAMLQPAFAHLYIVNPLVGGGLSSLFSTHPPVAERIRRLQAMAGVPAGR